MPYIDKNRRDVLVNIPEELDFSGHNILIDMERIESPGEIQYVIAEILNDYVARKGLRYQVLNDVMGALAGAQMEFYRKVVAPYESEKEEANGGIY